MGFGGSREKQFGSIQTLQGQMLTTALFQGQMLTTALYSFTIEVPLRLYGRHFFSVSFPTVTAGCYFVSTILHSIYITQYILHSALVR